MLVDLNLRITNVHCPSSPRLTYSPAFLRHQYLRHWGIDEDPPIFLLNDLNHLEGQLAGPASNVVGPTEVVAKDDRMQTKGGL